MNTSQPVMRGWRAFQCDACGKQWEAASRDHASPSGDYCICGEWVTPHSSVPDATLKCDKFGNLTQLYVREVVDE